MKYVNIRNIKSAVILIEQPSLIMMVVDVLVVFLEKGCSSYVDCGRKDESRHT